MQRFQGLGDREGQLGGEEQLQYYFRRMNFAFFPLREFTEALGVTAKVKSRLEPFIEQVENSNMEWLFQMMIQLYTYTTSPDCQLNFKFNSLVALKLLLDTCEYPVVLLTEVYFLPHIRKVATYQMHAADKQRGLDYFLSLNYPKEPDTKKLGYNYVRLASEIVTMMAAVKPYRLFRDQELTEASDFANALEIMRAQSWREYSSFAFYQEDEHQMRQIYLEKLHRFATHPDRYFDFLDTYLDKLIRKEYSPKVLDPRKIFESGQVFACDFVLETLKEMQTENRPSIKLNVLRLFTDFVRWGYIRAAYLIECEGIFDGLIGQAKSKGRTAFRSLGGSDEERRSLFVEVVRSLQIWAVCIPKNPMNLMAESKCSILYKEFLAEKVEVPYSGNMKKIRDESEANLERNQLINLYIMKELKKNDFDASKMRRTSSNLQELINLDKNMKAGMASLIMQAKFINDIPPSPDDSSASVVTHKSDPTFPTLNSHSHSPNNPLNLQTNVNSHNTPAPPPSPKEKKNQKSPFSKYPFRHHKTASLSRLVTGKCDFMTSEFAGTFLLREADNENYSQQFDQKFQINKLRYLQSKESFTNTPTTASRLQTPTKQARVLISNPQQEEDIQFFEEILRSNTNNGSNDSLSSFVIQVNKPMPLQEHPNMVRTVPSPRKDKATTIHPLSQSKSLKLHLRARSRNDLTVIPEKKEREIGRAWTVEGQEGLRWSCNEYMPDEDDRECMSYDLRAIPVERSFTVDQQRYLPFLKDFSNIERRKMLRNKDLLVKTNKVEIGFIFQVRSAQSGIFTLFITPQEVLKKLRIEMSCSAAVSCNGPGEGFSEIPKHKQRRLPFEFSVRPPFSLPKLIIEYQMEGRPYTHSIIVPLSFNKFVTFSPPLTTYSVPTAIIKTSRERINQDYQAEQILNFFAGFSLKQGIGVTEINGRGQWAGVCFNIAFLLREDLSIQIRCEVLGKTQSVGGACQGIQFLMAVLHAILKK